MANLLLEQINKGKQATELLETLVGVRQLLAALVELRTKGLLTIQGDLDDTFFPALVSYKDKVTNLLPGVD